VDRTPVWLLRQAGRFLPEYRALREHHSLLELCTTPELAAQVTLQPLHRFDVDAAIVFSEPVMPLRAMGLPLEFQEGVGLVVTSLLQSGTDIDRLGTADAVGGLAPVLETIRLVARELDGRRPILGFVAAPFTLACYAVDGARPGSCTATRTLMFAEPAAWERLCEKLVGVTVAFLAAQVDAGAHAVQVFDTWAGSLSEPDYRRHVLPWSRRVFEAVGHLGVPAIHYGLGTSDLLGAMRDAGGDVIGVDWRLPLDEAWERVGADRGIQGNLDPALLLGPTGDLLDRAADVLRRAGGRPGHIFNLGHGILPSTPPERVQALVRYVHSHRDR
jgi:uroporphyrinogen decarboxylase